MKNILQVLVLLTVATFCFGDTRSYNNYYSSRNSYDNQDNRRASNQEWSGYTYSLSEGRCTGTKLVQEDVSKDAAPFTVKKTTYTWMGRDMFYITCIKVTNAMRRDENAAEARITSGGVGEGKVSIEMISKNGQNLHFQVELWGESTRQQAENVAVLTNTPNKILYMGGKKYCEC